MSAIKPAITPISVERDLLGDFVHVVEEAAIASTRTMGQGDAKAADQAAVHAMRQAFEGIHMAGNIVIGEGERDKAPCCASVKQWARRLPAASSIRTWTSPWIPLKVRTCAPPAH